MTSILKTYLAIIEESIYGVRRIKTTIYIPLIPTFSLKGEGAGTCVDTYAAMGDSSRIVIQPDIVWQPR